MVKNKNCLTLYMPQFCSLGQRPRRKSEARISEVSAEVVRVEI